MGGLEEGDAVTFQEEVFRVIFGGEEQSGTKCVIVASAMRAEQGLYTQN